MSQRYIPGLTARPADVPNAPTPASIPKNVPQELIDGYKNGTKQPISAITEYAAMQRLTVSFKEVPVKNYSMNNKFANQCTVEGVAYPQGASDTKKKAKTKAAGIAFGIILGLESYEDYGEKDPRMVAVDDTEIVYRRSAKVLMNPTEQTGEYEAPPQKRDHTAIFNDYCASTGKVGRIEVGDDPGPFGFIGQCIISGRVVLEKTGKTKRAARIAALKDTVESLNMEKLLCEKKEAIEDEMAKQCYQKLEQLLADCQQCSEIHFSKHSFAAFIVKRGVDDKGEIVAMGTGNTCLSCDNISTDGRVLVDCYAVAVARRALLKYFYTEIKNYFGGSQVMSLFNESSPGVLQLKEHITIHLYLSQPPPGDYRECLDIPYDPLSPEQEELLPEGAHYPVFNDDLTGWFSVKNEDGLIEVVEEDQPPVQDFQELQEGSGDLLVMSCSDKILMWNAVGIQGGLNSNFLHPVYLSSIILGQNYHHGHFARSVCCRMYNVLDQYLPEHYHLNHPFLSTVTMEIEETEGKQTHYSINWSLGDEKPEIVDGFSGKVIDNSPFRSTKNPGPCASRLCKAAFLFRYRDIGNLLKNRQMLQAPDYSTAKQMATKYQVAKTAFKKFAFKIGLGNWIAKPKEMERFQK